MSESKPIRPDELAALFACLRPGLRGMCALAVSGGSDSTALMVLFGEWLRQRGEAGEQHTVLTVDHGLRSGSADEAQTVAAQAAALGFRHATLLWDGPKPRTGIQAAARVARYRLIGEYMKANGIALLLTGHTRDDQAETLVMRLARGSGLDGLAGMSPRLRFSDLGLGEPEPGEPEIARPLLEISNGRLRATLEARAIAWIEDPSNRSPEFERPRVRAARVQLQALGLTDAMLAMSARRLLRARQALDSAVDRFCSEEAGAVVIDPCGRIAIDRGRLQAAEEEIVVRVLGRAIAAAGGSDAPVPLGKLETIATKVHGAGAEVATWTLARAMISADVRTVTVEREPGRKSLPELKLEPGARACWDGRFWVEAAATVGTGALDVRSLGEAAVRELRDCGDLAAHVPGRVAGLVPSFWSGGKLVAVPSLDVWLPPVRRDALQARFVGHETIKGRRQGNQERLQKP